MKPGIGKIIQLHKRIKELKAALEPLAVCSNPKGVYVDGDKSSVTLTDCGVCNGCVAQKELEK